MLFLGLFLFEILLLFLLSRAVTRTISGTLYRITGNKTLSIGLYSLIFLPGTLIHEMSHFLVATILFVRTGQIRLFPHIIDNEIRLGSVAIGGTDPIRRLLIGIAPVIIGIILILTSVFYLASNINLRLPFQITWSTLIQVLILLYILFAIGNTMFASKKDMEGAAEVFLALFVIFLSLYFLGIRIPGALINNLFTKDVIELIQKANLFLAVPISLDLLLYLLLKAGSLKN